MILLAMLHSHFLFDRVALKFALCPAATSRGAIGGSRVNESETTRFVEETTLISCLSSLPTSRRQIGNEKDLSLVIPVDL